MIIAIFIFVEINIYTLGHEGKKIPTKFFIQFKVNETAVGDAVSVLYRARRALLVRSETTVLHLYMLYFGCGFSETTLFHKYIWFIWFSAGFD